MAQKRLSDFFSSVSKRTNENEDKTVEQLELNQKDKQDEEGKQVTTMLQCSSELCEQRIRVLYARILRICICQ